jgi:hypothetical protein
MAKHNRSMKVVVQGPELLAHPSHTHTAYRNSHQCKNYVSQQCQKYEKSKWQLNMLEYFLGIVGFGREMSCRERLRKTM